MQDRPDQSTLLEAVAQFLSTELLPKVPDKALAFRLMIAANLCTVVAAELRTEDDRLFAEVERLCALLNEPTATLSARRRERLTQLDRLNHALAERLRGNRFNADQLLAVRAHLKQTVLDTLAVVSPRFDIADDIE